MDDQDNKTGSGVQSPAPVAGRPLTDEDVALLRKGDVLRRRDGTVVTLMVDGLPDALYGETFIGRPDAEGWIFNPEGWAENPVPGVTVEYRCRSGSTWALPVSVFSEALRWGDSGWSGDIIAFRLSRPASEQPVEAIGAGREELLPCPFCGGEAEVVEIEDGENKGGSCVCCTRCQASSNVEFEFKENFRSNWNRRAVLSPASPARTPMGGEVVALREALEATVAKRWEMVGTPTDSEAANAWALALDEIAVVAAQALAASSPSPAQGGESGHVGTIEVLENLLRSGGETWLNSEQEWALKSAIAALSASPQPEAGEEDPSHHQVWTQERGWEHPTPPSVQPVEGK